VEADESDEEDGEEETDPFKLAEKRAKQERK